MSVLDTLITDRTQEDITKDTDKAYNSYLDLNRIEEACAFLADHLEVSIQTKTWDMSEFRTDTEMQRIRQNIQTLRDSYFVKETTPDIPGKITFGSIYQANDIEQILKDLGDMYDSMVSGQQRLAFRLGSKTIGNRR